MKSQPSQSLGDIKKQGGTCNKCGAPAKRRTYHEDGVEHSALVCTKSSYHWG